MAYLITCSNKKNEPTSCQSSIEELSYSTELLTTRKQLIDKSKIQLDWSKTLPAWQLYSGRLYSKVIAENWINAKVEIKILSALFGWIRHTDKIPKYNLMMDMMLPDLNQTVGLFWTKSKVLKCIAKPNDIDLLTNKYRKAIDGDIHNCGSIRPNIIFRDNYGSHKGIWLNNQLI